MAFWSTGTIQSRFPAEGIITVMSGGIWKPGYSSDMAKHGSYELSLGDEVFITSDSDGSKRFLKEHEQIAIPPGQFALLLTEERVKMPVNSLGFISIKAGKKFCGLVNVSGFHVDPGFDGRLKFSVYNAGSRNVVLTRGNPLFVLWISEFDSGHVDPYTRKVANEISDEDIMKIHGEIASPGNLLKRLQSIESFIAMAKTIFTTILIALVVTIIGGLVVNGVWDRVQKGSPSITDGKK